MSISASYPNLRPTLLLDFANSGRLDPRVTFTRASTATYFDETGVLRTAANNVPRFDYDPATLAARGLLIEEARTNLLTYSAAFDTTPTWSTSNSTVTANTSVSPDGSTTADTITDDATLGQHQVTQIVSVTSGISYTFTCFVKSGTAQYARISLGGAAMSFAAATFNLSTGTVSTGTGTISSVGNGWYRISCTSSATSTGLGNFAVGITNASGTTYSGVGDTLLVWGAQLEIASTTINSGTASGTTTAVVLSAGSATDDIYNGNVLFVNGEYRVITDYVGSTKTATVAALTATPSGAYVVTGGSAAFATSYIPTTTTALTRSADVASVNTLSPWYNATEGTLYAEAILGSDLSSTSIFRIQDATSDSNVIQIVGANSAGTLGPFGSVITGGASQGNVGTGAPVANTLYKSALAYKTDDLAFSKNGGAVSTDPLATLPVVDRVAIGARIDGANVLNGHVRRLTYYPRRLSNAELQSITA